jgi:hypothetical protein
MAAVSEKMMVARISAKTFSCAKPTARPVAELQSSNAAHMAAPFNKVASKTYNELSAVPVPVRAKTRKKWLDIESSPHWIRSKSRSRQP